MEIINEEESILGGPTGETITVRVTARNSVNAVAYDRNGETGVILEGQEYQFKLDSNCFLGLSLTYANQNGDGRYTIEISGNRGGQPFVRNYFQSFGIPGDEKNYDFRVLA